MRIGIDLGGTKIEGVLLDAAGAVVWRERIPTPRGDYAASVLAIRDLVAAAEAAGRGEEPACSGKASVGVGIPGVISPATGLVKNANSTWLIGKPLDQDLAAALRRPVRLENDANCLALSEAVDGAGAGAALVFGVILGTGTGGGIAIAGRPLTGANAIAGEWGHNPLPWPTDDERPGPLCYCGLHGCIETFLCGPALTRQMEAASGRALTGSQIATAAENGDPAASDVLDRYCRRLARSLATVINILDPDVIVVGGGLSNIPQIYERVPDYWPEWVFSDRIDTPLKPAMHGDSSGVRGAAWLV